LRDEQSREIAELPRASWKALNSVQLYDCRATSSLLEARDAQTRGSSAIVELSRVCKRGKRCKLEGALRLQSSLEFRAELESSLQLQRSFKFRVELEAPLEPALQLQRGWKGLEFEGNLQRKGFRREILANFSGSSARVRPVSGSGYDFSRGIN